MPDSTNKQPVPDRFKDISFDEKPKPKKAQESKPKSTPAAVGDRFSDISFDAPEVKKKDGTDISTNTGVPANNGTSNTDPSSSPLESSSAPAPAGGGFDKLPLAGDGISANTVNENVGFKNRSESEIFKRKQSKEPLSDHFKFDPDANVIDNIGSIHMANGAVIPISKRTIPITPYSNPNQFLTDFSNRQKNGITTKQDQDFIQKNVKAALNFNTNDETDLSDLSKNYGIDNSSSYTQDRLSTVKQIKSKIQKSEGDASDFTNPFSSAVMNKFRTDVNEGKDAEKRKNDLDRLNEIENKLIFQKNTEDIIPIYTDATLRTDNSGNNLKKFLNRVALLNPLTSVSGATVISQETEDALKKLPAEFSIGLNFLKYKDPEQYKRVVGMLEKGTALSESMVSNIIAQGIDSREYALNDAYKVGSVSEKEYVDELNNLQKTKYKNIVENKETYRAFLANGIANMADDFEQAKPDGTSEVALAKKIFGNRWSYDPEEIISYGKAVAQANGLDPNSAQTKEALDYLVENEGSMILQNSIAKDGWARDLGKGLAQPIRGISNAIEDLGKSYSDVYNESQSQGNVNASEQRLNRIQQSGWQNAISEVMEGTGQFLTQAGLAYITSGAIGAAGEGLAASNMGASTAGNLVGKTARIGEMLMGSKDAMATFITSYAQAYDSNLKQALSYTADDSKARVAANVLASLEGATELFLSPLEIAEGIGKKLLNKKEISKGIIDVLSDAAIVDKNAAVKNFLQSVLKGALATGKVGLAEIGEEEVTQLADFATNAFLNPDSKTFQNRNIANEISSTAYQTGLSMILPALMSGIGAYNVNKFSKGSLLVAGQNRQMLIDQMQERVSEGTMTQSEMNEKAMIVNGAADANKYLPLKANGKKLNPDEKADYVYSRVSEAILAKKSSESTDEAEKKILADKIKTQQDFRKEMLDRSDVPIYKFNGKEISKGEFLIRMNSKNVDDYDLEVTNDDAVQKALRKIGGKDISSLNTSKNGKVNSENGESGAKAKGGEEVSQANQNAGDASGSSNEQGAEKVTATGAAGDNTAAPLPKQKPARYGPNDITPAEQTAIDGFKGKKFEGSIKNWTDIIQSNESSPAEKKQALKELGEQLSDPESEIATGMALGTSAEGIYDLISSPKSTSDGKSNEEGSQKASSKEKERQKDVLNSDDNTGPGKTGSVSSDALKDVESTAKALVIAFKKDGVIDKDGYEFRNEKKVFPVVETFTKEMDDRYQKEVFDDEIKTAEEFVSEAYHKAKTDGSNPSLVKAVENLLAPKQEVKSSTTVSSEGVSGSALKDVEGKKADISIGKIPNTEYEVKSDGVYYKGNKLDNPENKTHRQLIEADIERRRQEELKNIIPIKNENITINDGTTDLVFKIITYKDGSTLVRHIKTGDTTASGDSKKFKGQPTLNDFQDVVKYDFDKNSKVIKTELVKNDYTDTESQKTTKAKEETINAKYDAELATLEETSGVSGSALKDKKADIERRRQEELKQPIKDKLQEIEKAVKTLNITTDKDGKLEQTSDEIITNIKSELDKIGLPYKGVASNENGSSYKVITNDGTEIEVVKLLKSGGALIKPTLSTAKFINHLIKTEPQTLRDLISNQINAKYDAEYIDKVKKGEFTKQQAKDALKEIGRLTPELEKQIDDAELKALEEQSTSAKKADIEIGKVGNTEYEVKVDGVYYQGKKLNNPENKTHRQLIEADIKRRRQEELDKETPLKNENITVDFGGGVSVKYQVITYKDGSVKISTVDEKAKRYNELSDEVFKDYAKIDFKSGAKGIIKTELIKDDYTDKQSQEIKAAKEKTINAKYDAELATLEETSGVSGSALKDKNGLNEDANKILGLHDNGVNFDLFDNNKLRQIAKDNGIDLPEGAKNADIIEALKKKQNVSKEQTQKAFEDLTEADIDKLSPSEKAKLYKENGITNEDGSEITEKDIQDNPLQYSYDFMASSNSGKWNSANSELESAVQGNKKQYSLYKLMAGEFDTFKEFVDFINSKNYGDKIEYTERMRRADETMTPEERKSAIDSYNKSAESKADDKAQKGKDVLKEHGFEDEKEYSPQEIIDRFPLKGVQKIIYDIIKNVADKLGIKVKFSSSRITEGFEGSNNPLNGEILISPHTLNNGRIGEVLVHEVVHALTTKIISRVNSGVETGLTSKQVAAVKGLKKLYDAVRNDNKLENKYPVKDIFEFIAHLTNDNFVKELESKDRNFLQKVVDFIADILGIGNANELAKKHLKDIISDGTFLEKEGITVKSSDYGANKQGSKLSPKQQLLEKIRDNSKQLSEKYHSEKENDIKKIADKLFNRKAPPQYTEAATPAKKESEGVSGSALKDVDFTAKGGNKIVDENGTPLTVYHGTNIDFDNFDKSKRGTNTDNGLFGKGFYFTENEKTAKSYGNKIKNVQISIKNPLKVSDFKNKTEMADHLGIDESILRDGGTGIGVLNEFSGVFSDALKEKGYDGVITKYGEFVVFEPTQIKEIKSSPKAPTQYTEAATPKPTVSSEEVGSGVGGDVETKQQIENFGVNKADVEPVHSVISQVFNGLKKAGLTAAKTVGDWVGIGKGSEKPYSLKIGDKEVQVKNTQPEVVNGFYSPLEKVITESKFDKLPAKQWAEKYANSEEAKWTGLKDWLAQQQGSVSKADIQKFLKDNRISVVEVVKDGEISEEEIDALLDDEVGQDMTRDEARSFLENDERQDDTKFSQYQLEGEKSKYKEVLVTMPNNSKYQNELNRLSKKYNAEANYKSLRESKATDSELEILRNLNTKGEKFKSSHFDEPNILVHLRMNTRKDSQGNKVLFLEEIQSDFGQQGKKEGFIKKEFSVTYRTENGIKDQSFPTREKAQEFVNKVGRENVSSAGIRELTNGKVPEAPFVTDTNAWTKLGLKVALKEAVKQGADKIAWSTGTQQFDRWGSEEIHWNTVMKPKGFEIVVKDDAKRPIVRGSRIKSLSSNDGSQNQQAEVKRLAEKWNLKPEDLEVIPSKGQWTLAINEQTDAQAFQGNEEALRSNKLEESDISVGTKAELRDAIKRNLSRERNDAEIDKLTDRIWNRMQTEDSGTSLPRKEGMEEFYGNPKDMERAKDFTVKKEGDVFAVKDEKGKTIRTFKQENEANKFKENYGLGIVGNVAKSLFKQEPNTVELQTTSTGIATQDKVLRLRDWVQKNKNEDYSYNDAQKDIENNSKLYQEYQKNIPTQHSIDITPELKASVEGGQPLFKDAEAQYRIESGKNIIEAIRDFDGSPRATVALTHEIMHPTVVAIIDGAKEGNEVGTKHTETIVNEFNKANPNNKVTAEDLIKGNDAFKEGTTTKQYRQVQEFIAKSWEKYHREGGKGFSEQFQKVLDQITQAFKSVYKSIKGKQLTPELIKMFDDILGKEQSIKETPKSENKPIQNEPAKVAPLTDNLQKAREAAAQQPAAQVEKNSRGQNKPSRQNVAPVEKIVPPAVNNIQDEIDKAIESKNNPEQQDKYKVLANGPYQKAIADGKMTATDAKNILESAEVEVPKDILELANKEQQPELKPSKPVKGDKVFDSKKNVEATITRVFSPAKNSPQVGEPFLMDLKYPDGKKAINQPIGERFSLVKPENIEQNGQSNNQQAGQSESGSTPDATGNAGDEHGFVVSPTAESVVTSVESKAESTDETELAEVVKQTTDIIDHNSTEIPKKKEIVKKVIKKVAQIVGLKRANMKEQKEDFLNQLSQVEKIMFDAHNIPESEQENIKKWAIDGVIGPPFYLTDTKEVLAEKGFESDGENVVILVKDNGTFRFKANDVITVKDMVSKRFPSTEKIANVLKLPPLRRAAKSQNYNVAISRGNLERNQQFVDTAQSNLDEATKVFEQAKKDGDESTAKSANNLIEIFKDDLSYQNEILKVAQGIDFEVENNPELKKIAGGLDGYVSGRELLDALNEFSLPLTKENAEKVIFLKDIQKDFSSVDNAKIEIQKETDKIISDRQEKYGYQNKEGIRKPKNKSEEAELNRWTNKINANDQILKYIKANEKELKGIAGPSILFSSKQDANDFKTDDNTPSTLQKLKAAYPDATVVQSQSELPEAVQRKAEERGIKEVEGVVYNGQVYMVADNLPTMGRADGVYRHETIGHQGVISVLKGKLDTFVGQLVENATGIQQNALNKLSQRLYGKDVSELNAQEKKTLGQEYIAQAAEQPIKYPTTWEKVKSFIKETLRNLGIKLSVSDNDIKVLLDRAAKFKNDLSSQNDEQTLFSGNYLQDLLNKVREDISMQEPVTIAPDLKKYGDEMIDWVKQDNSGATYNDVLAELDSEVGQQFTEAEKEPLYRYIRQKMSGKYVEPAAQQTQPAAAPQEPTGGDNGSGGNTGRRPSQTPMEGVGITHADTSDTRKEFNLPEYEKQAGTFQEWDEQARQRIADGKMQDVLDNLKMGFGLRDEVEQRMMGMYLAHLSDIAGETGANEDIRNLYEAIKLSDRVGGSVAAKILTARKGLFDNDASLAGYWAREMEATHVDELTDEQKELNKQEFEDRQKADKEYEKEIAKLKKQVARWKAKAKLKEEKERKERKASEKKKQSEPKTHEELVIEKEKITTSIKDKLRQARERKGNPGIKKQNAAAPGFAAAPAPNNNPKLTKSEALALVDDDMQDYIRTLVDDDNSIELDEVQNALYDILADDVEDLTMDDVTDVIAGDYTPTKKPLTDLQRMIRDIKEEARLVKKLKDLLEGKVPDRPDKKVERNKNIAALRKQIEEARKNIPDNERKLQNYIDRIKKQADKVEEKLNNNDLSTDQRSPFLDDPALKAEFPELFDEAVSEKERLTRMNKKMQELRKELPYDEKDLQRYIDRQNKEAERIQAKIDAGDYSTDKKKPSMMDDADVRANFPEQYQKALDAKDRVIKIKIDREVRLMKEELKNRTKFQKTKDAALEVLNMPRTLMSSVDFSAPLRQGVIPTITHPSMAFGIKVVNGKLVYHGAFWQMFKYAFKKNEFDRWFHDLKESPDFQIMMKAGLYVADPHNHKLSAKEDLFMNNLAEKIPWVGRLVSGSERAYVGYLNKMRVDLFRQGLDLLESRQKYIDTDLEDYQALAKWVGNSTGRGNMTDMMEKASPVLNATFFSPRLISSRLNLLNPVNYVQVFRTSPEVGKMMLGDMAKFVTFGLSVLGLAWLNSDCKNGKDKDGKRCSESVEVDPRSTDFGKIKSGNTRYDIWGGFQQYVRVIAQFGSGKVKSTSTGEIINISGEKEPGYKSYFGTDRGTIVGRFVRGKLAPIPSLITDLIQKHTGMGDKINMRVHAPIPFTTWGGELPDKPGEMDLTDRTMQMIEPLVWQDLYKGWQDNGVKSLFTTLLPSTFGLGVSTYEKKK